MAGNTMGMGDAYVSFADELDATDPVGATLASFVNCDLVNSDAAHLHPLGVAINAFTGECDDLEAGSGESGPEVDELGPPVDLDQPAPAETYELEQPQQQMEQPAFRVPTFNF